MIGRWLIKKVMDLLPAWLQVVIVLFFLGAMVWDYAFVVKDSSFILHNHTGRPISEAVVGDIWVGNAPVFDGHSTGSGVLCCAKLEESRVNVKWRLSVTQDQYDAGLRSEDKETMVSVPERGKDDAFLHVHIYADDDVTLFWSKTWHSRFQIIEGKEVPGYDNETRS